MRYLFALLMILFSSTVISQPTFELSRNVYRIPYGNGTAIQINQDHFTHDPLGRYDMEGYILGDICHVYPIAAAAAGIVRYAVDSHDTSCSSGCGIYNNYVWIEHRNGEWTKYTHMSKGSVDDAGIRVGDTVAAGTILGFQCSVGATSPAYNEHLHFEVRRPFLANPPIDPAGGFMAQADGDHLIPVINSISKHYWEKDDQMVASGSNSCTHSSINAGVQTIGFDAVRIYMASNTIDHGTNSVIFQNGGNGLFHAGNSVTLSPGFHAQSGSSFTAKIGSCAPTPF